MRRPIYFSVLGISLVRLPCPPAQLDSGGGAPYACRMSRLLILLGLTLILLGLLWGPLARLGLGRLPGDIVIERESFRLYIPITSAILVSAALTALLALIRFFLGR